MLEKKCALCGGKLSKLIPLQGDSWVICEHSPKDGIAHVETGVGVDLYVCTVCKNITMREAIMKQPKGKNLISAMMENG